jgi:hypothetical protein
MQRNTVYISSRPSSSSQQAHALGKLLLTPRVAC